MGLKAKNSPAPSGPQRRVLKVAAMEIVKTLVDVVQNSLSSGKPQ